MTLCYSGQEALLFDSQLLVPISPEVWLKQTSLLIDARLTYTQTSTSNTYTAEQEHSLQSPMEGDASALQTGLR